MADTEQLGQNAAAGGATQGIPPVAIPAGNLLALLADPDTALGLAFPMPRIGGEPPREFRAFTWGDNATTKGTLKLTAEGAQKLMDSYRARGVVKCFDYFHSTYNPAVAPDQRKAAGQFRLELRSDGLWFTDIQWTPAADAAIRAGEWPFISPAVMHSKDGVIAQIRNAGLVTDPGLIGAIPTVLSDSGSDPKSGSGSASPPKRIIKMADKKRAVLDAYSALEGAFKRCQALADTDGAEVELGNKSVGHMAPIMDMFRAHMGSAGYMDDANTGARTMAARDKMMSTLEAEFGESDPARLLGKVMAARIAPAPAAPAQLEGTLLSDADEAAAVKLLLDGHKTRYPVIKRAALESMGLAGVMTFLSNASEGVSAAPAPREAAPLAPTSKNLEDAMSVAPKPASIKGGKPTTLAECTPRQRVQVDAQLQSSRMFQGAQFNESTELQFALASLSDTDEGPNGTEIRHLPFGNDSAGKTAHLGEMS